MYRSQLPASRQLHIVLYKWSVQTVNISYRGRLENGSAAYCIMLWADSGFKHDLSRDILYRVLGDSVRRSTASWWSNEKGVLARRWMRKTTQKEVGQNLEREASSV